jgi:hypothetical protein
VQPGEFVMSRQYEMFSGSSAVADRVREFYDHMLPVAVSTLGTGLRQDTRLIMGWLGPRGLASIAFLLIAFEAFHEAGVSADPLMQARAWTILLSASKLPTSQDQGD